MKFLCASLSSVACASPLFALIAKPSLSPTTTWMCALSRNSNGSAVRGTITLRNDSSVAQKNRRLADFLDVCTGGPSNPKARPVQFVSQPYTSDIDHTGALSEAIVTLPREVRSGGSVELDYRLRGRHSARCHAAYPHWRAAEKLPATAIGTRSANRSRPFGESGYVAWYPVAIEAAKSCRTGEVVLEVLGRWKIVSKKRR